MATRTLVARCLGREVLSPRPQSSCSRAFSLPGFMVDQACIVNRAQSTLDSTERKLKSEDVSDCLVKSIV